MYKYIIQILLLLLFATDVYSSGSAENNNLSEQFNQALTLYQESDYEKSSEILDNLLLYNQDKVSEQVIMLRANNSYKLSSSLSENPEKIDTALSEVERAINWYKRLLEIKSENPKAAHNLELAYKLQEKILETNEEMKDKLDQLQKQQEQLAGDSDKDAEEHQSQQEELNDQTKELKEDMPNGNDQFKEEMEKADKLQQKALEEIEQGNYKDAAESQQKAADALDQAQQSLSDNNEDREQPDQTSQEEQSDSETDQIAQSIIENENNRDSSPDTTGVGVIVDRNW